MTLSDSKHNLSIKILFLNEISLFNCKQYLHEPWEVFSLQFFKSFIHDEFSNMDFPDVTISDNLKVPDSQVFGYLGETLHFLLTVKNDCSFGTVNNINIKIDLKTPRYRSSIFTEEFDDLLLPYSSVNRFVYFELNDLGTHTISSNIYYRKNEENLTNTKSFSFDVQKPIDIKTKYVTPELLSSFLLETRIQNISQNTLYLNNLNFKTLSNCDISCLNLFENNTKNIFKIQPKEISSFLYRINPKNKNCGYLKDIGKIDIFWEKKFGNGGRLQTGNLDRPLQTSFPDVQISIRKFSPNLFSKIPFNIEFEIYNSTQYSLQLQLTISKKPRGICWCGVSQFLLPDLSPNQCCKFKMCAISFFSGEHQLSCFVLRDIKTKKEYLFDNVLKLNINK